MAPPRYPIYRTPTLDAVISARLKNPNTDDAEGRSRSSLVTAIADRYAEICKRHMPDFSAGEWCLIFDVLNGCWMRENAALSANGIAHSVADGTTMDGMGEKWAVDGLDLARRIDALPFAGKIAILDTAERFWALGAKEGESYPDVVARLTGRDPCSSATP